MYLPLAQQRNQARHRPLLSGWDQWRRRLLRPTLLREARQDDREDPVRACRKAFRDHPRAKGQPGIYPRRDAVSLKSGV